jgi:type II secretory pathway component PulJ
MELLVALAIEGFIAGCIVAIIFQVSNVSSRSANHMSAIKQVEIAAHWISHDAMMAQVVETNGDSGFIPLRLKWVGWDTYAYEVTYTIVNGKLLRNESINNGQPSQTMIAQNINPNSQMTNCQYAAGVLSLKIYVSVQEGSRVSTEIREYKVVPRPS